MARRPTVLVVSQVYVPDPASVGQHMHDAARELAARGHRVVVLAAARGYDDPSRRYPRRERRDGVEIRRLGLASFGKERFVARLTGALSFVLQATLHGLLVRRLAGVLVSTSPPMASLAGVALARLRRAPLVYWMMDVNPDQAVATGAASPGALPARLLEASNRAAAAAARAVVVLDRFMAERLAARWPLAGKLHVLPPWPHAEPEAPLAHRDNPFRDEQALGDRIVVMYSGNMSPVHPLGTFLGAARRLAGDPRFVFLFVGGGAGRREVEEALGAGGLPNVRLLPYQPLERLRESLSAADVHLVSMGEAMVGIVHPCKIYGAMAVGRPVLLAGPAASHAGEIVAAAGCGWRVDHGDVDALVERLLELAATTPEERAELGERARRAVAERYSAARLRGGFADLVERAISRARPEPPAR